MKFVVHVEPGGKRHYEIIGPVSSIEFASWMEKLAASFGINAQYYMMPEADVARIVFPDGRIYAKLDLDYGLEMECAGLSQTLQEGFEEALSTW